MEHLLTKELSELGLLVLGGLACLLIIGGILLECYRQARLVRIGINPDMGKEQLHGIAWVKTVDGGIVKRPFLADKPQNLVKPKGYIIRDIFQQLARMGMYPDTLEIKVGQLTQVYKFGRRRPILVHS